MSLSDNETSDEEAAAACSVWPTTDLAVTGKLGVGVQCGWTPNYPTAYIHGALYVKDRTDTGQLNFVVNTGPAAFPQLNGSKTATSQLDLTGSLRIAGPPAGTPVDGIARLVVDGQPDSSGNDAVPLQLWRNSKAASLSIIDANGKLGLGTLQPLAPLDVAGNSHIGGSLSIGDGDYANSLTIQAAFSQEAPGAFTGQANIDKIDGDTNGFRIGDPFQILYAGNIIKTNQNSSFFEVKSLAEDHTWLTVTVPPAVNFNGATIYIEQSPVGIKNSKGNSLLTVNRYGDANIGGSLVVARDATIGGVLNGSNIIRETQITNDAVTNSKLATDAVTTLKLANDAVTNSKLANDAVTELKLANGAVTNPKLANDAVSELKLANDAVTNPKLATDAVSTLKLANDAVTNPKLANDAVSTLKLVNDAVTNPKLATDAVSTLKLANDAVTNPKLANDAVSTLKLANDAVTNPKLANDAVTESKLVNGAVTTAKIAARSVTVDKLGTYMIAGIVNPDGGRFSGDGFTSSRYAKGIYDVTFTPALSQVLGGSATQVYAWPMNPNGNGGDTKDNAVIVSLDNNRLRVKTGDGAGVPDNRAFSFVVITK